MKLELTWPSGFSSRRLSALAKGSASAPATAARKAEVLASRNCSAISEASILRTTFRYRSQTGSELAQAAAVQRLIQSRRRWQFPAAEAFIGIFTEGMTARCRSARLASLALASAATAQRAFPTCPAEIPRRQRQLLHLPKLPENLE